MSINGTSRTFSQWPVTPEIEQNQPKSAGHVEIELVEPMLSVADRALASFNAKTGDVTPLLMGAAQQKLVVMAMAGKNSETAITSALTASVEHYGGQLDLVNKWTDGGKSGFDAANIQMYDSLNKGGLSGIEYENMFHIVLLDVLSNGSAYGLLDYNFVTELGYLLEKTGSGCHTNWDFTPEEIGAKVNSVWSTFYNAIQSGKIPTDSIAYKAMLALSGNNLSSTTPTELSRRFTSGAYNDPNGGGWITNDLNDLSPMARIVLLSALMSEYRTVSAAEVEVIITGNKSEVDGLLVKLTTMDAMAYLFSAKCPGWQDSSDPKKSLPPGVTQAFDFDGTISAQYLEDLYNKFTPRKLTEVDIKEINRIGDQVKMLQQAIKYWLQVCRDGKLAIARNI